MKFIRDIIAEKTQQSGKNKLESHQEAFGQSDIQAEPQPAQAEPEVSLGDIMRASMPPVAHPVEPVDEKKYVVPDAAFDDVDFDDFDDQNVAVDTAEYAGAFDVGVTSGSAFMDLEQIEDDVSPNAADDPFDTANDPVDEGYTFGSDPFVATSSFQISGNPKDVAADKADDKAEDDHDDDADGNGDENLFAEPIDIAEDKDLTTAEEVREQAIEALNEDSPIAEPKAEPVSETPFVPPPLPEPVPVESEIPENQIPEKVAPPEPISQPDVRSVLPEPVDVPAPAVGRGAARAGRVKTRLLGFRAGQGASPDPFQKATQEQSNSVTHFPVGWLVVSNGPGRGAAFTLFNGVTQIGRGKDQTVCLDFGDNSISRESHAAIAYDAESKKFYVGHGGKANLVRLNNRPVLSTEEMQSGNTIRVGETTLHFVALCGEEFQWDDEQQENFKNAAYN